MPIPAAAANILVEVLKVAAYHLGERLAQNVVYHHSPQAQYSSSLVPVEQVKSDPRYVKAQVEYLKRKYVRDSEFLMISAVQGEKRLQLQEQELRDRRELSRLQRELMRELHTQAIQVKLTEIKTLWDKDTWLSNLSRQETEQILQRQQHRLLLLVSPPKISEDCPASRNNLEIDLRSVGTFLSQHYPQHSKLCPVEFYSDYFKRPISDIDVKRLQTVLAPVPTAILYSDISDYEVNFRIGFWGDQNSDVFLFPTQAWDWEQAKQKLEAAGENEQKSLRLIRQLIVAVHKLLSAFLGDLYYLNIEPNYEPQLFSLASEFPQEWVKPYVEMLKNIQIQKWKDYEQELQSLAQQEAQEKIEAERKRQQALEEQAKVETERKRRQALERQEWKCVHILTEHSDDVNCVAISPDGQTLASGCDDKTIKIWELGSGKIIRTITGHLDWVYSVAFSMEGEALASGSKDNTIKLWQMNTGKLIRTLTGHSERVFSVAINLDGEILASGSGDATIKLWQPDSGKIIRILTGPSDYIRSVAISPDGQTLASGSDDNTINLWQISSGKLIRCNLSHSNQVYAIAFSSDGQTLASGSADRTIKLWELRSGKLIRTLTQYEGSVFSLAFSPDGQILASGSGDNTIKLWKVDSGKLIRTLAGHSGAVYSIAFSPDGQTLVSGSADKTIKIWRCDRSCSNLPFSCNTSHRQPFENYP